MLFTIFCIDKPNMREKRATAMPDHIEYLNAQTKIKNIMSGPLMDDEMENIVGSLYLLEAPNRTAIEEFTKGDPLVAADIWTSIEIRAFNKRVDNRD
ncbi:MAG TPA: YciI family protein [Rhodospirillales bacterium]|nr:YciI family protein [Rhodospirillales bacterium]